GTFTMEKVYLNFSATGFFASLLGMLILAANQFRKPKPEELLVLVWSFLIFLTIYGQNRFAYYYSINVSVLSAYLGGLLLEKVNWSELDQKFKSTIKSPADIPEALKLVRVEQVLAVLLIVVFLIYPVYGSAIPYTKMVYGQPIQPWEDACTWLRSNTPDPGMDYNAIYEAPKNGELFNYPDTAYGVMSWWDYGHYIETIGHRMPNANPFQAGIGGRTSSINETNRPGATTFLTAPSEEEASAVLEAIDPRPDKAGARYIMSDARMATDIFWSIATWTLDNKGYTQVYLIDKEYRSLPTTRYFNTMEAKLHIFDGNGLKQYRMIHETEAYQTNELLYKQV
ncbi:MAG TPA: oligosaccharyl transferase, archaeosortase A system-associated, partial [Methanosarcina vacuolata]|nr:oligosaccharyl transferase, archaeosortase A system-associated [Methanosarcina vacuolata]